MIHTTLTRNSTTLYSCENLQLTNAIKNVNCFEIVAQELGLINSSKTLIGSIPLTDVGTSFDLAIFFIKKLLNNPDGSSDLITVISVAHANINKALVLSILKKITDKYIEFRHEVDENDKKKVGEFKLYMSQIIKFEEMNYSSNQRIYNYGSTEEDAINPRNLVLVNEEVEEVRQLMLDNISKLMARGDKINLLVDQTDRLTSSSLVFQKRAQLIRQNMWLSSARFYIIMVLGVIFIIYFILGSTCGFPLFSHCIRR